MNELRVRDPLVLVVEDQALTEQPCQATLEAFGYRTMLARTGEEAVSILDEVEPDLILQELLLPDVDGLLLCGRLADRTRAPIIVCSDTKRKRDGVLALKLGADDFIAKPVDIYVLQAHLEAALRRTASATPPDARQAALPIRIGELRIDTSRRVVTLSEEPVHLTPTEFRLLALLASNPGVVLSRDELAEKVWGYRDAAASRTIDVHMRRLRAKLSGGHSPAPDIVAVRGFGYTLAEGHRDGRAMAGSRA